MFIMTTAHIINLKHRTDRYEKIYNRCKDIKSINLQRFDALEGTPGWVYCGLSHLEIIKQNKDKGESILIFEDDCYIQNLKSFDKQWEKIKNWLDNNLDKWDVFNGGPSCVEKSKYMKVLDKELKIVEINVGKTTHFIYYNKNSFDKILKWDQNNNVQIDEFHIWNNDIKIITAYPYLATQFNSYSDISNIQINYDKYFRRSQKFIANYLSSLV